MTPIDEESTTAPGTLSRRDLLAGATATVAGAALAGPTDLAWAGPAAPAVAGPWRHGGRLAQRGVDIGIRAGKDQEGRFGVMFKKLEGFAPPTTLSAASRGA